MSSIADRPLTAADKAEGLRKIAVMMERAGINPALPGPPKADIEAQRRLLQEQARMIREG